jgi:hypothetical protein
VNTLIVSGCCLLFLAWSYFLAAICQAVDKLEQWLAFFGGSVAESDGMFAASTFDHKGTTAFEKIPVKPLFEAQVF